MEDPIRIAWIDDKFADPADPRTRQANAIMEAGENGLKMELVASTTEACRVWIEQYDNNNEPKPDIIILDLKLAQAPKFWNSIKLDDGFKLSKALDLTSLRPVPRYLISAIFDGREAGPKVSGFDWILADSSESSTVSEQLIRDGLDYRFLKDFTHNDKTSDTAMNALIDRLKPPKQDRSEIRDLIDEAFGRADRQFDAKRLNTMDSAGIGADENMLVLSRWLRGTFLTRLGLLLDAPSVANILGVNELFFLEEIAGRIEEEWPSAGYGGMFCDLSSRRWWRSAILDWILSGHENLTLGPLSQMAQEIASKLEVADKHLARCAVCEKLWPDVVAHDDDDQDQLRQVHRSCSKAVDNQDIVPGFDEVRLFIKN